jgi:hypothetical protein
VHESIRAGDFAVAEQHLEKMFVALKGQHSLVTMKMHHNLAMLRFMKQDYCSGMRMFELKLRSALVLHNPSITAATCYMKAIGQFMKGQVYFCEELLTLSRDIYLNHCGEVFPEILSFIEKMAMNPKPRLQLTFFWDEPSESIKIYQKWLDPLPASMLAPVPAPMPAPAVALAGGGASDRKRKASETDLFEDLKSDSIQFQKIAARLSPQSDQCKLILDHLDTYLDMLKGQVARAKQAL